MCVHNCSINLVGKDAAGGGSNNVLGIIGSGAREVVGNEADVAAPLARTPTRLR